MALKSVDDVDVGEFDDELSATEIVYLAKNFRNFLRNNNRRARGKNNVERRNFRKNDLTKVNNIEKPREKGKAIAVTLSDNEVSDDESGSNEDGNFITFTATAVVSESVSVEDNPSDVELSKDADLQEAYNKLCKVAAKDAMNVDLDLKKIASFELDKKNLLVKLEQSIKSASSKLDHMLSVQKSPSDKTSLGFVESISASASYSKNFVPSSSSEPPVCELVKPIEVTTPRKIRVDLKESKPKESTLSKDKLHGKPAWVYHFCGKSGHIRPNCFKLQATRRANKAKVPVPQAQDPIVLIGELNKISMV
ncbi:uncharacterized protein LOC136066251 [Quercus suber]|uniref:uncharacterized protein LOC136066251 n=1 Tax=Quercus suber TaxID=58331 RepID=UPI0032DE9192